MFNSQILLHSFKTKGLPWVYFQSDLVYNLTARGGDRQDPPAQRPLNEDDGNEDDVGHDAHPAQAGQNYCRDLLILNTAFLFSILCATIVHFVKNGINFNSF